MPQVASVCGTAWKYLNIRNPLSGLTFNAPSDGDGDLPLVTLQFDRFPGILTGLSPCVVDFDMSCLPVDRRFVNGSVNLLEVIWFTERDFVHRIFVV